MGVERVVFSRVQKKNDLCDFLIPFINWVPWNHTKLSKTQGLLEWTQSNNLWGRTEVKGRKNIKERVPHFRQQEGTEQREGLK
jgi:hypothetical protein